MKCPRCNADSDVLETRSSGPWIRRSRECFNLHRFMTLEVYPENVNIESRDDLSHQMITSMKRWMVTQ